MLFIYIAATLLGFSLIFMCFFKNNKNNEENELDKLKRENIRLQKQRMRMIEMSILRQQKVIKRDIIGKRY